MYDDDDRDVIFYRPEMRPPGTEPKIKSPDNTARKGKEYLEVIEESIEMKRKPTRPHIIDADEALGVKNNGDNPNPPSAFSSMVKNDADLD